MKIISLISFIALLAVAGCGGKKGGGGSSSGVFTNALSTQEGFYNIQSQQLEFGGASYPASQYSQYVNQAYQQAMMNRVVPINVGGFQKFRARMTASVAGGYTGTYPGGYQPYPTYPNQPYPQYPQYPGQYPQYPGQYPNTGYGQQQLMIQSLIFY